MVNNLKWNAKTGETTEKLNLLVAFVFRTRHQLVDLWTDVRRTHDVQCTFVCKQPSHISYCALSHENKLPLLAMPSVLAGRKHLI